MRGFYHFKICVPGARFRHLPCRSLPAACCRLALFAMLAMVFPAAADTDGPRFPIRKYEVEGSSYFTRQQLEASVAPYTGEQASFESIESAVEALRRLYDTHGMQAVRVSIPKQQIENGVVRLQIIEARLGKILIQGNQHFGNDNILRSLPSLKTGGLPNIQALGDNLRLADESFARQSQVTFRQGDDPTNVDAVVNVADADPRRAAIVLDNTGDETTGDWRLGFAFLHANLFDRDHTLAMQFVTSPGHWEDVKIFGMSYRIPFYETGDALEFTASHSTVDSGQVNTTSGSYGISGGGDSFGARYIMLLPRLSGWDQRLSFGADYRKYNNDITFSGASDQSLVPDVETHPLNLTYSGFYRQPEQEWSLSLGWHHNVPGGEDGDQDAIDRSRLGADADYDIVRYALQYSHNFGSGWQARASLDGQWTRDALISAEQFGLGGVYSVRGFHERALANDYGQRGSLELQTPDLGRYLKAGNLKLNLLGFYDTADACRNDALPGEDDRNHLSSAGLGVRGSFGQHFHLRMDVARVLDGGGIEGDGDVRAHLNLFLLF